MEDLTILNNGYYLDIVGGDENNDLDTDFETLADATNWNVVEVDNSDNAEIPNRFQWETR